MCVTLEEWREHHIWLKKKKSNLPKTILSLNDKYLVQETEQMADNTHTEKEGNNNNNNNNSQQQKLFKTEKMTTWS